MNVSASKIWNAQNCKKSSFRTNKCSYPGVTNDDRLNLNNSETYNLQFTNNKMMMKITINTDCINMYRSINMWNSKLWYQYKQNKLTYRFHDNDCLNNKKCDFKVKIVVGMC